MSSNTFSAALFFTLCLTLVVSFISAQERAEQNATRYTQTDPKPTNCENHIAVLEAAHHDAGKDGLIVIIARQGTGENRRDLSRRRQYNARAYLTDYLRLRAPETIVTAAGEPVKGYGRIELYVGGKLYYVLALNHNADLIVGSCEPEELDDALQKVLRKKLYPWLHQKQPPKSRKPATKP
jgi:hypothetical protein